MSSYSVRRRKGMGFVSILLATAITFGIIGGFWDFLGDLIFGNRSNNETPDTTRATTAPTQAPETEPSGKPETETVGEPEIIQIETNSHLSEYFLSPESENYWDRAFVAALRSDGTVRVACKEESRHLFAAAEHWTDITRIWVRGSSILGLKEDGTMVCTGGYYVGDLENVADITFTDGGFYALCRDGTVCFASDEAGYAYPDSEILSWKDVQVIFPFSEQYPAWGFFMLRNDGTTATTGSQNAHLDGLTNVADIFQLNGRGGALFRDNEYLYFGEDDPEADSMLWGAVKLVPWQDMLFGLNPEGDLMTSCGLDAYDVRYAAPGMYARLPHRTTLIRDILDCQDMRGGCVVFLYEDGTLYSTSEGLNYEIENWTDVVYVGWVEEYDTSVLYGLRSDGSVLALRCDFGFQDCQPLTDYSNWNLEWLYITRFSGAIGCTKDGRLVGDHVFGELDLSVLTK